MFIHIRNAVSGVNGAFYDRFRIPKEKLIASLDGLPPTSSPVVQVELDQIRRYIKGTIVILHSLFVKYQGSQPVLGKKALFSVSLANGERLFSLLMIGLIRLCTVADNDAGDILCELAITLIPKDVVPAANRLAQAMRVSNVQICQTKLIGIFRQLFQHLDFFELLKIEGVILHVCAALNRDQHSSELLHPASYSRF